MDKILKHKHKLKGLLLVVAAFGFIGCKEALDVESGAGLPSLLEPNNGVPTISSPPSTTFYSNDSDLLIEGVCSEGARVSLNGDSTETTTCSNSRYSFSVNRVTDGSYSFNISQIVAGVNSGAANLLWIRKTSVSNPAVTTPSTNPYSSSNTTLSMMGSCETGATIELTGDATGSDLCVDSSFNIDVLKFIDGVYNININQRDQAGNTSSIVFQWNKGALSVIPDNPQIVATTTQIFSILGGSGSYAVVFLDNQSGGTFDSMTNTYTAGTVAGAGVIDQLEITDSQGFTRIIDIDVLAAAPDHFDFPVVSGDGQNILVGNDLALPLSAKVVDQYGNGVPNVSVLFQNTSGDVYFADPSLQITDANGDAFLNVRQGFSSFRNYVTASSFIGVFPDVVLSSRTSLPFQILSNDNNSGNFDLDFNVANGPDNQIIADVNGDTFLDVLVLNKGDNSVSVLPGVGNGLMGVLPKKTGLCSGPSSMVSGLFDGDATVDIMMSCTGGEYSFIPGNGNGTFGTVVNTLISGGESFPVDIASADLDGDTFLDIVITSAGTAKVAVRMGANDGTFGAPTLYDTGASPSRVIIGDVDNLNGNDIIVINAGVDSFGVYLNDGSGGFLAAVNYSTGVAPAAITLADFNSSGYLDIVVANNVDDNISVYLNNLNGTFNLGINTAVGDGPISVVADLVDGDAFQDLIVANINDSTVSVLYGANNGTFSPQPAIPSAANPINVGIADFNGDSSNDILVVSSGEAKIQIYPGQASGELGFVSDTGNNPSASLSADFDNDGIVDKAVLNRNDGTITRLKGLGNGLFISMGANVTTGGAPNDGVIEDLNGDGNADIIFTDFGTNALRVLLGNGDGTFSLPSNYATGLQPSSLVSGDFNLDGHTDIVVTNSSPNSISFFPGTGTGTFGPRIDTTSVGAQPSAIVAADFNDDQRLDVAIANQSGNEIGVLMSNGNGTFQAVVSYPAQSGTNGLVTGYFNTDNFIDIAASNNIASSVSVFLGQTGGAFASGVSYFSGFDPVGIKKGDFNGDNREDLLLANGINQTMTIMWGSLSGAFSTSETINTNINSVNVEVDDLNDDGALDISVLDGNNGKMKILLGH